MAYTGGTTRGSGWAMLIFLVGFTVLGTAPIGGGFISLIIGAAIIAVSFGMFKTARVEEEA